MILTKFIKKYNKLIPIEKLSKGSSLKIKVKCDICGYEKKLSYFKYLKNIKKYNIYSCSQKCAHISGKYKKTCLERYGVEHHFQSEKIKDRTKQTKLERYGDKDYNNIEKQFKTNLELYGIEHQFQSKDIQKKIKQTLFDNYGVENSFESEIIRKKSKITNLKIYGVEFPFQSEEIQEKYKQTMIQKYGVENPRQLPEIFNKLFKTKYGISHDEYLKQLPDFKRYRNEVWKITRKQPLHLLKNIEKRKRDKYWLDHKFSISEGFKQNICPYIIGNIINLEMLTWESNLSKNNKCSITKEKLFKKYDNNNI